MRINQELTKAWTAEVTNSLFYFDKKILGYSAELRPEKVGMEEDVHLDFCNFVQGRYLEPDEKELKPFKLCLMPRGSFKTSAITVGYSIQSIILNPDIRILIANETFDNAKKFLNEIKGHFESNERLRLVYGDYVDKKNWTREEITVSRRKKRYKEPTISLAGVEVLRVGMHYDLIIMDDLVSKTNISSKEMIEGVIDWYKLALSLLEPTGKIIIIGTRWTFYDLYNFIITHEQHKFNKFVRAAWDEKGKLFFPSRLSQQYLDNQRQSQGSYLFSGQYLNNPVDDEHAAFKKDWIKYYEVNSLLQYRPTDVPDSYEGGVSDVKYWRLENMNTYLTIDPAIAKDKYSDSTGMVVCAIDPDDRVFVLEALRMKLNPTALINKIFKLMDKYPLKKIGIETAIFQLVLAHTLFNEMKARKKYLPIEELKVSWVRSKEDRISGLIPRFEFGTMFLRKDQQDLIDEMLRFPVGRHDDILDALAHQLQLLRKPSTSEVKLAPEGSLDWYKEKIIPKGDYDDYIGNQKIKSWGSYNGEN